MGGLNDARLEAWFRQGQGLVTLARETLTDRLGLAGLDPVSVTQATGAQVRVELGEVVDLEHGRGPIALQVTNPPFDVRLLLRPTHQAETRLEGIMTDQHLIAVVELALPTPVEMRHDGLGIVPPQLPRHATEERQRLHQTVQDGLGAFGRQGHGEGTIGVCPGADQNRHLAAAIGEIDVDMAEVALQALAGIVIERNERLPLRPPLGQQVLPDALVAAGVAILVAQTPEHLGHRVPLFARRVRVGADDGVNDRFEGIHDRRHGPALVLLRLRLTQDLANLPPRMVKAAAKLANAELIDAVGLSDAGILVHLDHPPPPVA